MPVNITYVALVVQKYAVLRLLLEMKIKNGSIRIGSTSDGELLLASLCCILVAEEGESAGRWTALLKLRVGGGNEQEDRW